MLLCVEQGNHLSIAVIALSLLLCSAIFAASATQPVPNDEPQFSQALSPRQWSFPRNHGRHDTFKTEWWYFTGNLTDEDGHEFGYQLTFFRTAIAPVTATRPSRWAMHDLYFAHAAISDVRRQKFLFKDRMSRGRPGLAGSSDQTLDVRLLDWKAVLEKGAIRLRASEDSFSIELSCAGGRGPILQGPGGINAKGRNPGQASYYYSMTRLDTDGILALAGKQFHVKGQTWMDHEFSSNALSPEQTGWDWFGLSLTDGNDLMIYRLRNRAGGADFLSGTVISPDGAARYLSGDDISLESSKPWTSPTSGAAYPQQWAVSVRGMPGLIVRSRFSGQELITEASTKVDYFEGCAEVLNSKGGTIGDGYLEMTGYGKSLGGF